MHIERVPEGAPPLPPPSDPPLRYCEARGARYSYTVEGPEDGAPIILIHGIPGNVRDFRYLGPLLGARARVFRFELPGFGGSRDARLPSPWPRARAEAVLAFADAHALERFAVLGHSMGGRTALEVAGRWPERVRQLVLLASVGLRRHQGFRASPPLMRAFLRLARIPGLRAPVLRSLRDGFRRAGFTHADESPDDEILWQFELAASIDFAGARRAVTRVRCPTLVASADDDRLVERAVAEELTLRLRDARLLTFDRGKHNIQKSRAPELAEAILDLIGLP